MSEPVAQHSLEVVASSAALRDRRWRGKLGVATLVMGFGLASLGCSWGHRHHKPQLPAPWRPACVEYESHFDANDMALNEGVSLASNICVADGGLSVGVVEFDDEGTHWDRRQLRRVEEEIRAIGEAQASGTIATRGILLMAFVHGWGNSGSEGSRALLDFRKIARYVAGSSSICNWRHGHGGWPNAAGNVTCGSRPYVVAVYLAWHGDSLGLGSVYAKTRTRETDWLGALRVPTFWARKSAARRAGGTPMTETLLRLLGAVEAVDRGRGEHAAGESAGASLSARSRSLVIGHSLGAGVVERAFAPVVVARQMEQTRRLALGPAADHLPNLVVLLNPAIEALSATNLIQAMETVGARPPGEPRQPQAPRIVSIASSTDRVTRRIFPGGLYVGRALMLRPTNRMRTNTPFGDYGKLTTHSAAHHPGVQSHWLRREVCADGVDVGIPFRVAGQPYRLCRAEKPTREAPYWVFTVPPELLPDHRDIFTPGLFDFILDLMRYQPAGAANGAASVGHSPDAAQDGTQQQRPGH